MSMWQSQTSGMCHSDISNSWKPYQIKSKRNIPLTNHKLATVVTLKKFNEIFNTSTLNYLRFKFAADKKNNKK